MAKEKAKLKPEVAQKYAIVGDWSRCHFFGEHGTVDFNELTMERAESLVIGGFPYLLRLQREDRKKTTPLSIEAEKIETIVKFDSEPASE